MTEYMSRFNPDLDPRASGIAQVLAHFDRIADLYADDHEFLKAMFVAAFEAVKTTSPLRRRVRSQLEAGEKKVGSGSEEGRPGRFGPGRHQRPPRGRRHQHRGVRHCVPMDHTARGV